MVSGAQAQLGFTTFNTGVARPIAVFQPKGDSRLFIVNQRTSTTGSVRILKNGSMLATPFLSVTTSTGSEQGLLGLAFHPSFPTTPYVYVNYTMASGSTRISRFTVQNPGDDVTQTVSELALLTITQPFSNHNGGTIHFDETGMLVIGMGDGGDGNDPGNRSQDPNTPYGKMLRIDVNTDDFPVDPAKNYGIPTGNMFAGGGGLPEIYSYGWRNPWQWSFDRAELGGIGGQWVFDVGQSAFEEVSYDPYTGSGKNFGWRVKEAFLTTGLGGGTGPFVDPLYAYPRSEGTSISGGVMYRGVNLGPDNYQRVFFADYGDSDLRSFAVTLNPVTREATTVANSFIRHFSVAANFRISAVNADASGELYCGSTSSNIYPITMTGADAGTALEGKVNFLSLAPAASGPKVINAELVTRSKTYNWVLSLQPDGSFRLPKFSDEGTLRIKADHWLAKKIAYPASATAITGLEFNLINGDCNGDNSVTTDDYLIFNLAFDTVWGDAGFDERADLDNDGTVTTDDYLILSESFDLDGDV